MTEAITPAVGWAVLHLFCKVTPLADAGGVLRAKRVLEAGDEVVAAGDDATEVDGATEAQHQLVPVAMLGHKADVGFMAIGPDMWRLRQFQTDVEAAGLEVVDSYLSLTELSEYAANMPEERKQARLYPQLPPAGKPAFCFYPMSKRREAVDNWYSLPYADREKMMYAHGGTGRTFAGRVLQVVTGSTGIDDFEWGVTLFAVRPDDLKECVYTMRFDEVSARYADFGSFYTGVVADLHEVLTAVGVHN